MYRQVQNDMPSWIPFKHTESRREKERDRETEIDTNTDV